MVTKQRQTIRQRIKSRMKGLAALLMSVALVVGMMPAVETRAETPPDNYYLIGYVFGYDALLCKGKESVAGKSVFGTWTNASVGNSYVNRNNDNQLDVPAGSPLTLVGRIGGAAPSQAFEMEVSEKTTFFIGSISGGQFYIEVKLDGVSQGISTGQGASKTADFNILAGKYTVQHTSSENYSKHIVDIKTVISSLTLSKTSLEFTVGDPEQQLTVQPDTAKVKWSSSNPNVASVDDSGKVTPVGVGNADITVALQTDENVKATCKVNVKAKEKPAATVDKAPTARTLTYTGSAQELVTDGEATGGTMQYALGENATTAPTTGYTTSIPTATDAGTYYVWYKAVGDADHSDSDAEVVTVTIKEKTEAHTHDIKHVEAKEPTCTEDGYEAHYECTICHEWFGDETGSVPLDKKDYTKKATGHKWDDGVITKGATYYATGIRTYTCSVCGETKEETIPMKTRDYDSDSSSDGETSGGGSSGKSGSISTKSIDVNGNTVQTQPDSGAPLSDRGGNWGNQEHIWTYTKSDGSLAKGEWLNLEYDGHTYWYYFDDSTIMQTNWFDYNGSRYFLVPEMDGWRGRMATGWHMVDNKWYYFEPTIGANQGILYRGMTTPDGHTVGADGAWDGNGTTPVGAIHTGTTVTMN